MRLRKFDSIERVVKVHGDTEAYNELQWLLKLARTNFAACYGTGTQGPDAHDEAITMLGTIFQRNRGVGNYIIIIITRICRWLYAQAKEKCTCQAPKFITGCENAIATKEDGVDECTCTTGECPWVRHTGTFL